MNPVRNHSNFLYAIGPGRLTRDTLRTVSRGQINAFSYLPFVDCFSWDKATLPSSYLNERKPRVVAGKWGQLRRVPNPFLSVFRSALST